MHNFKQALDTEIEARFLSTQLLQLISTYISNTNNAVYFIGGQI